MSVKPLVMISSMATKEVLRELLGQYQASSATMVQALSAGGVDVAKRVRGGEAFDIVVLARDAMDQLARDGHLVPDSCTDVVRSGISVAVRAGAPQPDIASEDALRLAVLNASSLGYSTGPSGIHLLKLFERWGILEQIRARIVQPPPGVPVGGLVASGTVALGFQQLSELMHLAGVHVLGPLPAAVQSITTFSAAVVRGCAQEEGAHACIAFLASPGTAAAKIRHGMEPA